MLFGVGSPSPRRLIRGNGVAQLVKRQDQVHIHACVRVPSGAQEQHMFFRVKNVVLTRCRYTHE